MQAGNDARERKSKDHWPESITVLVQQEHWFEKCWPGRGSWWVRCAEKGFWSSSSPKRPSSSQHSSSASSGRYLGKQWGGKSSFQWDKMTLSTYRVCPSSGVDTFTEEPSVAPVSSQVDAERDELDGHRLLPKVKHHLHQLSITGCQFIQHWGSS